MVVMGCTIAVLAKFGTHLRRSDRLAWPLDGQVTPSSRASEGRRRPAGFGAPRADTEFNE
jgi:hypothetical protein